MDESPALDIKFERLVATAIEATIIVVESRLYGDPVPSLRAHRTRIVEERASLYQSYEDVGRPVIDQLLYIYGFEALHRVYRSDSHSVLDELRRIFVELLFHDATARAVCPASTTVAPLTAPARAHE